MGHPGRCRLTGMGTPAGQQGDGRGPRQGSGLRQAAGGGFGSYRGIQLFCALRRFSAALSSAFLLCLTAHPCCALRPYPALRPTVVSQGSGGFGALRACGHGNACGAAGGWAGPTAGELVEDPCHEVGSGFFGDWSHDAPFGASLLCLWRFSVL